MDWLERMNAALGYVEDNLDGEIEVRRAAALAGISPWQFTRMFAAVADLPLSEYIRRRRMSAAALALAGGMPVTQAAATYGYDSATAFTRAFKAVHGIPPSMARQKGNRLVTFPRISFQISIKGVCEMVYRMEEGQALRLVGLKWEVSTKDGQNLVDIPKLWAKLGRADCERLAAMIDGSGPKGLLGVCANMREGRFDYYIAVATRQSTPEGMQVLDVPATNWAVFESIGPIPEAIQAVWKRIYTEWFPVSGYREPAGAAELEVYPMGDTGSPDYRCEVWIPVEKA